MAEVSGTTIETRGPQMFPRLSDEEIARLGKFGEARSYRAGDYIVRVGEPGPGLMLILSGEVEVTQHTGDERNPYRHPRPAARSWASSPNCPAGPPWSTR